MKYIKYVLLTFIILFLNSNVFALQTTTIYGSNTSSGLGGTNHFNYRDSNNGVIKAGDLNTVYSNMSYTFSFFISKSVAVNKTYKIRMNFNDYDFYKGVNSSYVKVQSYNDDEPNEWCTIVDFALVNQGGGSNQAKAVDISYTCSQAGNITYLAMAKRDSITDNYLRLTTIDWRLNNVQWEQVQTDGTQDIINNQTNNTQNIINNDNQNTQDIINSNKVCNIYDNGAIKTNGYLWTNGTIDGASSTLNGITDYININGATIQFLQNDNVGFYSCFYKQDKSLISCFQTNNVSLNTNINIPNNAYYIRVSINRASDRPQFKVCKNGNQALSDSQQALSDAQQETNDILTDDDIGGSADDAGDFINNFNTNTFGLTSIITAPLNLINSLTSSTCTKLEIPLPYLTNKKIELPCMTPIYQSTFGSLFTMYQTITFGIIAYWVCVRIFNMVKDFKNPEHDEIEVVDL